MTICIVVVPLPSVLSIHLVASKQVLTPDIEKLPE